MTDLHEGEQREASNAPSTASCAGLTRASIVRAADHRE